MFLRVLCVITSALTVLTTLSMTSCGADNTISSEASESAVTSTADSGKTAKDILSAIEGDHMDASTFYGEDRFTKNTEKLYGIEADKLSDGGILYSSDGNYADETSSAMEEYFTPLTAIMLTRYQCLKWLTEAVQKASLQTG